MTTTRLPALLSATLMLATVAACGGQASAATPREAVEKYLQAVVDGDHEQICALVAVDFDAPTDAEVEVCTERYAEREADDSEEGKKEREVLEWQRKRAQEVLDSDSLKAGETKDGKATVTSREEEGSAARFRTLEVDGKWYVNFDFEPRYEDSE